MLNLLDHVTGDAIGLASTLILGGIALAEDLKSRVATDFVLLAQVLVLGTVDLAKLNVLFLQDTRSLLILGSYRRCVSSFAPLRLP